MKTWLSTLTIVSVLALGSAQATTLRLGAEGGLGMATLSTNTTTNYTTRTGLEAGGIMEVGFNEFVSLQLEANYVQKGAGISLLAGGVATTTLMYDYFEVPLYLKFTADLPIVKPFIGVGPYIAFNLNAQSAPANTSSGYTGIATNIANFPSTDFGASGILGAEFAITPVVSLFAAIRYDLGFTDLDATALSTVKTRALLFTAGLLVGL